MCILPLVACSLIDLDGLSGGDAIAEAGVDATAADAAPVDAGAIDATVDAANDEPDADASSLDGSDRSDAMDASDAASGDALADLDARADTGVVDAGPWCLGQGTHTLCSDFDEGSLYFDYSDAGKQWSPDSYGNAIGGLSSSTPSPTSAPAAFLSVLHHVDAGGSGSAAALTYSIPTTSTRVDVAFDYLLSEAQPLSVGQANLVAFFQITASGGYIPQFITWDSTGLTFFNEVGLADGGLTVSDQRSLPFSTAWQRVHLIITRTKPTGHIYLSVDGQVLRDDDAVTVGANVATMLLTVGLSTQTAVPEIGAFYDNVTVDITP